MVGALGTAAAVLGGAVPAGAAVQGGAVNDPAEGSRADVARAEVRYDDAAGALELLLTLHRAIDPAAGDPPTFTWLLTASRTATGACDVSRESVGVEASLESGVAVLRLPDERRVPATVEVSGTTARITASDAALAGLPVGCAQLLTATGDEVPGFPVGPGGGAPPTPAPPGTPGSGKGSGSGSGSGAGSGGGSGSIPGTGTGGSTDRGGSSSRYGGGTVTSNTAPLGTTDFRIGKATVTSKRISPRRVRVTARALVCGPTGTIRLRVRYRLQRGERLGKVRTIRFDRRQKVRCQRQRVEWTVKVASAARYDVRAALGASLLAPPASASGA